MDYLSTRQVARLLGVSANLLGRAVRSGGVEPRQRSPSGSYLWTLSDIEQVSQVLVRKPRSSQKRSPNAVAKRADALGRANMRSRHQVVHRLARPKTVRKKTRLIPSRLRDWLWKVSGRAMKAFFDALLDHYGGQ
jgi:DNA-binding transcriptional MerR regulator